MPLKSLLLVMVAVWPSLHSMAQGGLSVEAFTPLSKDMTARTLHPERDANGDLTALIKVETNASGFVFEGGSLGIVKAEQKEGEWWVYIPSGARALTIRHPQLGVLRNYAYPTAISAGNVYEMKLVHGELEVTIKETHLATEFVIINSEPPGADVYLNNEPVGKTPFSADKAEGSYEWRVMSDLYLPQSGVFELKAGEKQNLNVTLQPNFGTLDVVSVPEAGAAISVNGFKTGKTTPTKMEEVPAGEQKLTLSHSWYETTTQKVDVIAGQTQQVRINMQPNFAELTVEANSDEEVYLNDSEKGSGRWTGRLAPGVYRIEVRKASHKPATRQLTLVRGDNEMVQLTPKPIFGALKVQSDPMGAEVYLNGQRYGTTPEIIHDLLIGDYVLELRKNGFVALHKELEMREGEVAEVDVQLKEGAEFKEVKIGDQVWMVENLNVDKFRNGDRISHANTKKKWKRAGEKNQPAWCYYDNDPANGKEYGKLYNWYAVNDPRGIAPEGWHVSSDAEWTQLTDFLGGKNFSGSKMKSNSGWAENGNGTNESGFTGVPGGGRSNDGLFDYIGEYGFWWSSTEYDTNDAWSRGFYYGNGYVGRYYYSKEDGLSVRCLRD